MLAGSGGGSRAAAPDARTAASGDRGTVASQRAGMVATAAIHAGAVRGDSPVTDVAFPAGRPEPARGDDWRAGPSPTLPSDHGDFTRHGIRSRLGSPVEDRVVATQILVHRADSTGHGRLGAVWARAAVFARSVEGRSEENWDGSTLRLVSAQIDAGTHNQAINSCTVLPQILSITCGDEVATAALAAMQKTARRRQQEATATNGKAKPRMVLPLCKADAHVAEVVAQARGLSEVALKGVTHDGKHHQPDTTLRLWASHGVRRLTLCRPADPFGWPLGTETFVGGKSFATATTVKFVFCRPKEDNRADMNQQGRLATEAASEDFSSVAVVTKPTSSMVPWFDIWQACADVTAKRTAHVPTIDTDRGTFSRCFLGSDTTCRCTVVSASTMSSRIKELCIRAEAVDADSSATAHHVRHSTLSVAHQWVGVMQARKPTMDRAIHQHGDVSLQAFASSAAGMLRGVGSGSIGRDSRRRPACCSFFRPIKHIARKARLSDATSFLLLSEANRET